MSLDPLERMAYAIFGKKAKETAKKEKYVQLELQLEKAQMSTRAEALLAKAWFLGVIAAIVGIVLGFILGFLLFPKMLSGSLLVIIQVLLIAVLPIGLFFGVVEGMLGNPASVAKARAKDIDSNLAYASNYMAAMASADVIPAVIFKGLANQDIYGEIKGEAGMIARDLELFGHDLMKVLERGMDRSPSIKFQDFLQGIITTSSSGGSLKAYFMSKAEQFTKENRVEQHSTLETLGVMAESFVTVVVAMPLFLIVMMSVMAMMGGQSGTQFLYIICAVMIPMFQVLFIVILSGIKVE